MNLMVWIAVSCSTCLAYFLYAILYHNIFYNPGDLGDMISGMAAFVLLPSFFIAWTKDKRDDKRKRQELAIDVATKQMEADMHLFEHLNHQFDSYGRSLRYMLDKKTNIKPPVTWKKWQDENGDNDIFGYLKVGYFSKKSAESTLDKISQEENFKHICRRFCMHVDIVIEDWEKLNQRLRRNSEDMDIIRTHPVCEIREYLRSKIM